MSEDNESLRPVVHPPIDRPASPDPDQQIVHEVAMLRAQLGGLRRLVLVLGALLAVVAAAVPTAAVLLWPALPAGIELDTGRVTIRDGQFGAVLSANGLDVWDEGRRHSVRADAMHITHPGRGSVRLGIERDPRRANLVLIHPGSEHARPSMASLFVATDLAAIQLHSPDGRTEVHLDEQVIDAASALRPAPR